LSVGDLNLPSGAVDTDPLPFWHLPHLPLFSTPVPSYFLSPLNPAKKCYQDCILVLLFQD